MLGFDEKSISIVYISGINATITSQMNELMAILDISQETRSFEKFRTTLQKLKEAFKYIVKDEKNAQVLLTRASSNNR